MKNRLFLLMAGCMSLLACSASANVITVSTAPGATTGGLAVDASATFTTSADTLTITLSDLQANPSSVGQLLSDLSFRLTTGQTSGSSLSSSSGTELTIGNNGAFTVGSTVATGWGFSTSGSTFLLNVLGTATGPAHLIIGPPDSSSVYSAANGSIGGNGPHNPFLQGSADFILTIPGVTSATSVNDIIFSFGTTAGNNVPGGTPNTSVPDGGTTILLMGVALSGLGLLRRKLG